MNKHVLLILKWMKNPESVTCKEFYKYYDTTGFQNPQGSLAFVIEKVFDSTARENREKTEEWINEWFKLSGENRDDYERIL
jgi:hypothetical protein